MRTALYKPSLWIAAALILCGACSKTGNEQQTGKNYPQQVLAEFEGGVVTIDVTTTS